MRNIGVVVVLLLGVAACGDSPSGDAFLGTYSVTSHKWDIGQGETIPCADAPEVPGDPFIELIEDPITEGFIELLSCAAVGDCVTAESFLTPGGPGLEKEGYNTQTSGGITDCGLYASRTTVALTGDQLRVEVRSWSEYPDIPASECDLEMARDLLDSPNCREVEIWDATRLAAPN